METRTYIALFILLLSAVQNSTALLEARNVLHIPEKIIGGVIDIVHSHKTKLPTTTEGPVQPVYQGNQQYPWNPNNNYNSGYQGHFHGSGYVSYGTQPGSNYAQGNYPVNSGQYQSGSVQPGYGGGQYQNYPQNQGGNQYQGQNQQGYEGQQTNFQQQSGFNVQKPQNQFQGQNQGVHYGNQPGQFQGNYQQVQQPQTGQFTGQGVQTGQYENQQSGHFVSQVGQQNGQYPGQNQQVQGQGFVNGQGTGWQNGSFQASGSQQPTGVGPTCVCQAWTKPQNDDGSGKSEEAEKTPETSL